MSRDAHGITGLKWADREVAYLARFYGHKVEGRKRSSFSGGLSVVCFSKWPYHVLSWSNRDQNEMPSKGYGRMFLSKPIVPLSTSGPCSIRFSSEPSFSVSNPRRETRVQCGAGFLTRTFLRSQRRLLNYKHPLVLLLAQGSSPNKRGNFLSLVKIAQMARCH